MPSTRGSTLATAILAFIFSCSAQRLVKPQLRQLPEAAIPVNLYELLGPRAYAVGVASQPHRCYQALRKHMSPAGDLNATVAKLQDKLVQDLIAAVAAARGVLPLSLDARSTVAQTVSVEPGADDIPSRMGALLQDPQYGLYVKSVTKVLLKYTIISHEHFRGDPAKRYFELACRDEGVANMLIGKLASPLQPSSNCANESAAFAEYGLFGELDWSLGDIARSVLQGGGWCGMNPAYKPYGRWLKRNRLVKRRGQGSRDDSAILTSNLGNEHKDRLVFLLDLLYERQEVSKTQWWLGSAVQQNPFDMYAIQDIIYQIQPDLIIETGTGNGGSALQWASGLELLSDMGQGRAGARVITIDITQPAQAHSIGKFTPKRPIADPAKNPLWAKYVTFYHGATYDRKIYDQVKAAAAKAQAVLVILDSGQTGSQMLDECKAYCRLVTPGSFCIVQNTRVQRFNALGSKQLAPLQEYMLREGWWWFEADREREPFYTRHPGGYLKRKAS